MGPACPPQWRPGPQLLGHCYSHRALRRRAHDASPQERIRSHQVPLSLFNRPAPRPRPPVRAGARGRLVLGLNSPAEGVNSPAEGVNSPSEGVNSPAEGVNSPAEGVNSKGEGVNSYIVTAGRKYTNTQDGDERRLTPLSTSILHRALLEQRV
eukprot:9469206-Pyramimonas_sp.AAC.1